MLSYQHPLVAREAWPLLGLALMLAIVSSLRWGWMGASIAWVFFLYLLYVFRDPPRRVPSLPLAVVSPVDGVVEEVKATRDRWLQRDALCVRLRTTYRDIYTLRSPIEGKVLRQFVQRSDEKKGKAAGVNAFWIQTDEHDDIVLVVEVGHFPSQLRYYAHPGMRVGQGQRCGYLFFGGAVALYLPANSRVDLQVGQHLAAGSAVVGHLVHDEVGAASAPQPA